MDGSSHEKLKWQASVYQFPLGKTYPVQCQIYGKGWQSHLKEVVELFSILSIEKN